MSLEAGRRLAHYTILGPLGAGAMGEVYRARDTRLDREVAIKVLPEHFAGDSERLRRFEREAKSLASLNHPNIAQIYGVDQHASTYFLALELVPGETLEERLKRGPLPLEEALDVARQIAEGLEAAHEAGVIHRDLKPANVRLTPEGKVKVLDFGLAKSASDSHTASSTDSVLSTEAGRLLGTPTYMAPEQARGKAIDKRVDIWAFGCVLYECVTAKRAFVGETLTDVFAAVLEREPDWTMLPAATPPRVRELLERCFAKDPRARLRDAGEARVALQRAERSPTAERAANGRVDPHPARALRVLPWLLCALLGGLAAYSALHVDSGARGSKAEVAAHFEIPRVRDGASFPVISPDGRFVVSSADGALWLRSLAEPTARRLEGTERGSGAFWSPDSRHVGFFVEGKLKRVPLNGAPAEFIADCPPGWPEAAWSNDGTILFDLTESTQEEGFYVVPPGARVAKKIRGFPQDRAIGPDKAYPSFLPDGRHFLFTQPSEGQPYLHIGSLDSDEVRRLVVAASRVQYVEPGWLLYVRAGVLLAQAFDAKALELRGDPLELQRDVYWFGPTGYAAFSASQEGTLIFQRVLGGSSLCWFDRDGKNLETVLPAGSRRSGLDLSPDGKQLAYCERDPRDGTTDMWVVDLERKIPTRLTSAFRGEYGPRWDPSGRRIAFEADWQGPPNIRLLELATGAVRELVPFDRHVQSASSWTPDGSALLYSASSGSRDADLWTLDLASGERRELLVTEFDESEPRLSPDGRRVAFTSDSSGRSEVHLMSFPSCAERMRLSTDGGGNPQWSADGSELFFQAFDDALYSVAIQSDGEGRVRAEPPSLLFRLPKNTLGDWCVARDGRRFLIALGSSENARPTDEVLVHWPALLGR